MEKKYKLIDEIIDFEGRKLHRIKALKDFSNVKKGDRGGFVESEDNLSQYNNCWIHDDAIVYSSAKICDNAIVYGNVRVCDNAIIYGDARVFGNAQVCDNTRVFDNAKILGNTIVYNKAKIFGSARIFDNVVVCNNAEIYDNAAICDNTIICDNAKVYGKAVIHGDSEICDDAIICGNANIFNADINRNAKVASTSDYIVFKNWWSSGRYFTWTRSNNMWSVGCFYGTGEELIAKAYKDSELSGREYKRVVKYVESIINEDKTIVIE